MRQSHEVLRPYLAELEAQPWIEGATVRRDPERGPLLDLRTPKGRKTLRLLHATSNLGVASAAGFLATAEQEGPAILFAPYVSEPMASRFVSGRLMFVDRLGNLYLDFPPNYSARKQTRHASKKLPQDQSLRGPGYQVVLALLTIPHLLNGTVRELAEAAGTSRQAANQTPKILVERGSIVRTRKGRVWSPAQWDDLLQFWVNGYLRSLRPHLVIDRYRTRENDPIEREQTFEKCMSKRAVFRWSGAAASRRLTGHYLGTTTVAHLETEHVGRVVGGMHAVRADDGPLTLLGIPGPAALMGPKSHVAAPALVYAELLAENNERAREAALEIRTKYLPPPERP